MLLCVAGFLMILTGCRQQAYTELYVEHMASEIRALEDRIYEYDAEYRALEDELIYAQDRNYQLEQQLYGSHSSSGIELSKPAPHEWEIPEVLMDEQGGEELGPAAPITPRADPRADAASGSSGDIDIGGESLLPGGSGASNEAMPAPANPFPSGGSPLEAPPTGDDRTRNPVGDGTNNTTRRNSPGENAPNVRVGSRRSTGQEVPAFSDDDLQMPDFQMGSGNADFIDIQPPSTSFQPNERHIELSQISVPGDPAVVTASAERRLSRDPDAEKFAFHSDSNSDNQRQISGIQFHGSLCRGVNIEGDADDDAVYVVLQPIDSNGRVINVRADMTLVVVDPDSTAADQRIGFKQFSADEVVAATKQLGESQGVHLTIPWSLGKPTTNRLQLFVKMQMENGFSCVNERELLIRNGGQEGFGWSPRSGNQLQTNSSVQAPIIMPPNAQQYHSANDS